MQKNVPSRRELDLAVSRAARFPGILEIDEPSPMQPLAGGALMLFAVLPALLVAWAFAFVVRRNARRWGLVDEPDARKAHGAPVPLGGGVAIWLGVVATFGMAHLGLLMASSSELVAAWIPSFAQGHLGGLREKSLDLWVLLACGTVLMLLGLWDDRKGVHWAWRLGVEVAVAAFCVYWQGTRLTIFIELPIITWALSVLWIVALINSFNMLDNMDGASGGVACIISLTLSLFLLFPPLSSKMEPQLFVAGFLMVLAGALLGFLIHNRPPARLFMGDAGAYFIGFYIAVATLLATYTSYRSPTPHAVLAPICASAVPLYDMVTVLWIRIRAGESPVKADRNHFSHRLVDLGLTKTQAVLTLYLTTATCGLAALLLHRVDLTGAVIVVGVVVCSLSVINILETTARRKIKP